LLSSIFPGDNPVVASINPDQMNGPGRGPFRPATMVVVTLGNPREKFWGAILELAPEGLSLSGIELASFEDLVLMVKDAEPFSPSLVFFPMHRIERIELDLPDGNITSLSQRFQSKTGQDPLTLLLRQTAANLPHREESA
jgi:hypothetical protein